MADRADLAADVEAAVASVPPGASVDRKTNEAARRTRAVSMALAGLTFEQIGEALEISDVAARQLVNRTLEQSRNRAVDELRTIENARLDRAQAAIWTDVISGDLKAVTAFLRISERRARLNGLDAPTKVAMSVQVQQEMEQAFRHLEEVVLVPTEVVEHDVAQIEMDAALTQEYDLDAGE